MKPFKFFVIFLTILLITLSACSENKQTNSDAAKNTDEKTNQIIVEITDDSAQNNLKSLA